MIGITPDNVFVRLLRKFMQSVFGITRVADNIIALTPIQTNRGLRLNWQAGANGTTLETSAGQGTTVSADIFVGSTSLRAVGSGNGFVVGSNSLLLFNSASNGAGTNDAALARVANGIISLSDASTGGGALRFPSRAAPSAAAGFGAIYAKTPAATAEVFVMDGAGNETQISPHNMAAPEWMYDAEDPMPRVQYEANYYVGVVRYTNLSRKDRLVELQLAGKKMPTGDAARFVHTETFAEHNARLKLIGPDALVVRDWDADQLAEHHAYHERRAAELAALAEWESKPEDARGEAPTVRPDCDLRVPCPAWIASRKAEVARK